MMVGMSHPKPRSDRGSTGVIIETPAADSITPVRDTAKVTIAGQIYTYLSFICFAKSLRKVSTMSMGYMTSRIGAAMEMMTLMPKLEITHEKSVKTMTKHL